MSTPRIVMLAGLVALLLSESRAHAQDSTSPPDEELPPGMAPEEDEPPRPVAEEAAAPEAPADPMRIFGTVGGGSSVRIVKNLDFQQTRFAPAFVDVFAAYLFPGASALRHGAGLGLSVNLSGDGSHATGFDGFSQWAFAPSYLAYLRLSPDLVFTGKGSLPIVLASAGLPGQTVTEPSLGLGLELGAVFFVTAGLGVYAEAAGQAYLGADSSVHPLVSGEAGLAIDYEVLP